MKRIIGIITALLLVIGAGTLTTSAAGATADLSGPGTLRAGDTITVIFSLSGSGLYGASGTLSYNSSHLTLKSTTQKAASPWVVEFNGNSFVAYDNNLSNPINGTKEIFSATFQVSSTVSAGTTIQVSCTGVTASDGSADANVGTVSYSKTVSPPLSSDNTLGSLSVSNASIRPAFSPNTTSYTAQVPYEVSKLNMHATANHSSAKVSVSNPYLTEDATTRVTVTVTAENGSTRSYTIAVTRAKNPNYIPSSDNSLAGISVEGFLLSPGFSTDHTQYVIWLPYETETVSVSATANDSKADVEVRGGDGLVAGADNEIQVICTAEDGSAKVYTVIAKRAAAHDAPEEETTEPTVPETTESTEPTLPQKNEPEQPKVPVYRNKLFWVAVSACAVCLGVGIGMGILIGRKTIW